MNNNPVIGAIKKDRIDALSLDVRVIDSLGGVIEGQTDHVLHVIGSDAL